MSNFRERLNAHLPILLQLISTLSLVVIALSAICGSQSLKELSEYHEAIQTEELLGNHNH
ncbi:hypothetical protein [Prochlorococcus marinus]|uniref:hypothetical protein n=1 Tax=Prochlorococcus marinus TaxID=1219 RepID=UPI0022B50157|nr:hypothetical protein [Prochlorococcus marinus]